MEWLNGKTGLDGHVRRNHIRVAFLLAGFLVAAELMVLPVAAVGSFFYPSPGWILREPLTFLAYFTPPIAAGATCFFLLRWWRFPAATGARLAAQSGTPACRRVQCLVKELAALNGLPEPQVLMIQSPALNAFAAGFGAHNATIIITSGLESSLSDAELRAVLAHEMAHLAGGDTRVMAASAIMVETLDAMRRFSLWRNGLGWKTGLMIIFMPILILIGALFARISALADTIGRGTRLIVASSREMIADAEAIRMTRDPAALVSALTKIDGRSGVGTFPRAIEAMMIDGMANGPEATHPTIEERIRVIAELTGEHFPLPAAATKRNLDRPTVSGRLQSRAAFGLAKQNLQAEPGRDKGFLGGTAFGRVREGQGKLVKKSTGFKIAVSIGVAFFLYAQWSAHSTFNQFRAKVPSGTVENTTFRRLGNPNANTIPAQPVSTRPASPGARTPPLPSMPPLRGAL